MTTAAVDSTRQTSLQMTPWGEASSLRSRKLRPGPGQQRADVERNQRERLYGATVATVAKHGYEATRVADVLEVAGVSRSAFYRYFDDLEQCYLATLDAIVELTTATVGARFADADRGDGRSRSVLEVLVELIVMQPAAARICLVDIYAAGPAAVGRIERLVDRVEQLSVAALEQAPQRAGMPRDGVRAVIGGIRQIIHMRLVERREQELPKLVPDLLDWALGYRTPPVRLRQPRKPPPLPSPTPDPDDQRRRILATVTEAIATKGYQQLTISEIAQGASISLTTFYAHFATKQDVFLAALSDAERQLIEATAPAFTQAPDWPTAVHDCLYSSFAFNAHHPAMATLGGLAIFAGGPVGFDRHQRVSRRAETILREGYRRCPETPPIVGEAIAASIAALLYQQIRRKGADRLYEVAPLATLIALAPFIGTDEACEIANSSWQPAS